MEQEMKKVKADIRELKAEISNTQQALSSADLKDDDKKFYCDCLERKEKHILALQEKENRLLGLLSAGLHTPSSVSSGSSAAAVSVHEYQGVIVDCMVVARDGPHFPIELLVDTGFTGEVQLPLAKCEQLGLTAKELVPVDRPGGVVTYEYEYREQVQLIIKMDDGSDRRQFVVVTAAPSSLTSTSVSATASHLAHPSLLYNESDTSSGSEAESSPSAAVVVAPSATPAARPRRPEYSLLGTKKLSPVKFDEKVEGKYHITDCLLGFAGLQQFNFRIDPRQRRICAVFRHPRFI